MVLSNDAETAYVWLEKQQLQALGLAFEQILAQLQTVQITIPLTPEASQPEEIPETLDTHTHEYHVSRLAVGYDEERELITIFVHENEAEEGEAPDFICRLTTDLSGELAVQIRRVVSSGARQQSNGHFRDISL